MRKTLLVPTTVLAVILAVLAPAPADHTPDPATVTVTVAGDLQEELGCPGDFQPGCAVTHLIFDAGDDAWQGTFNVPAGNRQYRAALSDSWDENYSLDNGFGSSFVSIEIYVDGVPVYQQLDEEMVQGYVWEVVNIGWTGSGPVFETVDVQVAD